MVNQPALLHQLQSARSPTVNPRLPAVSLKSPMDKSKLQPRLPLQSHKSLTARSKPPPLWSPRSLMARSRPPALFQTHALRSSTVSHNAQVPLDTQCQATVLTAPLLRQPHPLHLRLALVYPSALATRPSVSLLAFSLLPCYKRTALRTQLHSLRRCLMSDTLRSLTRFYLWW